MKIITFVRHGKSSWDGLVDDRKRLLTQRGKDDSIIIGKDLRIVLSTVDGIYTSPARRTRDTCKIVVSQLESKLEIGVKEMLYDFHGDSVKSFIQNLPKKLSHVLLFGHNYAFTRLINTLSDARLDNLPTAGTATIHFKTDNWRAIDEGALVHFSTPKQLKIISSDID